MNDPSSFKGSPPFMPSEVAGDNPLKAPAGKLPRICLHAKVCRRTLGKFGPEETASLDAVLASVNQLIKRLDIEFGDDCCKPDHGVAMETKQGPDTKSLNVIKESPTLTSASFGEEDNKTGASKQQNSTCGDGTQRGLGSAAANQSDINKAKTLAEENEEFIKSGATSEKENNSNFIAKEVRKKFETNNSKKNYDTKPRESLSKQMTSTPSELNSHQASHKKLSLPIVESFQLKQHLSEERIHETFDEAVYLAEANQRQNSSKNSKNECCETKTNDHQTIFKVDTTEYPQSAFVSAPPGNSFCNSETFSPQLPFAKVQNEFSPNKEKKKQITQFFSKVTSYKETNTSPLKVVLPKKKISKGKEVDDLKQINRNDSSDFSLHKCESRNTNFPSELTSSNSASIYSGNFPQRDRKSLPKQKAHLIKQKKFGLKFRRSQSLEAKPLLQCESERPWRENLIKLKIKPNFVVPAPSTAPVRTETTTYSERDPTQFFTNTPSPSDQEEANNFEICSDFHVSMNTEIKDKTNPIQESKPKDFHNKMDRQKRASGVITNRSGSKPNRSSLMHSSHSSIEYLSVSQSRHEAVEPPNFQPREPYSSVHVWTPLDSDGSLRSSQDSLEEHNCSPRFNHDSRRSNLGRQCENFNEQNGLESVAKLANKIGKKKKLRKTLKKARTVPIYGTDEMAERTWSPMGNGTWSNLNGKSVELDSIRLQSLSELESDAIQKVALNRLHEADISVSIVLPKDESKTSHRKLSIKKKYGVHLSSKDKNKDKNRSDHVFGIPLVNVVENDQLLRLQKSASFSMSSELHSSEVANGAVTTPNNGERGSNLSSSSDSGTGSSSSIHNQLSSPYNYPDDEEDASPQRLISKQSSSDNLSSDCEVFSNTNGTENFSQNHPQTPTSAKQSPCTASQPLRRRGAIAADSINEIDPYQSQLLEALSLTVSGTTTNQRKEKKRSLLPPTMPSVPYVVQKCCDHIKKYGLDVTGIFRIAGSKKRVKQLREEFDRGMDVTIDEDYNPHDVAALLKEFFRDLPEALFTRELYPAFIQTAKLSKQERLSCLRYLLWLLPQANRDTLYTLLNFLAIVATHSETSVDRAGNKVPGNKMNGANLATIFGPNIMHRYKKSSQSGNDNNHYQVQNLEKPEESTAVIKIVTDLIADQVQLFQVPKEEHDDTLRVLKETDPEAVDFLLRRKAANYMRLTSMEKTRLPSSPTSLSSPKERHSHLNERIDGVPEFQESVIESKIDEESQLSNDYMINSGPQSGLYSGVRSSYRRATCRSDTTVKSASYNANTKLKFKRPTFENTQDHFLTDEDSHTYKSQTDNNGGLEEPIDDVTEVMEKSKLVDGSAQSSFESTASLSVITQDQSLTFSDDDILQIIGHKNEEEEMLSRSVVPMIQEFRCTDECCDNTKKQVTFQQATEVVEPFECAQCETNKLYFMKSRLAKPGNSPDSGILADYTSNNVFSPSMINYHDHFCFQHQSDQILETRTSDFTSPSNVDEKPDWHCNESQNDLILEELVANHKEVPISDYPIKKNEYNVSSNHLAKRANKELTDECNSRCSSEKHMQIENSNVSHISDNNINLDWQEDVSNQVLQLHPSTVSAINAVLSPSEEQNPHSVQRPRPSVRRQVAVSDKKTSSAEFRPTPLPRRRLQQNLNQQPTPSQAGQSEISHTKQRINPERKKSQEETEVFSPELVQTQQASNKNVMFSKPTVYIKGNKSHSVTKSPQQASHKVAALARRFSKEDLALPAPKKVTPGSGWTSAGLIGNTGTNLKHCGFRQNSRRICSTKEHKLVTSTTSSGHLSWHLAGRDNTLSQETLV